MNILKEHLMLNFGRLALAICAATLLISACGGGSSGAAGTNGVSGLSARVLMTNESAGAHCATGGSRLDAGLDANGNGLLDAAEITSTQYVCNGATGTAGTNTLVQMSNEAAGTNCANGGKKVTAGADMNANGVLDSAEITSTGYVCNGAAGAAGGTGATGASGTSSLMDIVAEAAGSHCANGGSKVTAGPDTNGNGLLDSPEIIATRYVCNGTDGAAGNNGNSSLMSIVAEAAGAHCASGGSKITSGADTNGNGLLDTAEVTSTGYACNGSAGANGTNGTNGSNGTNSLIAIATEVAGANCANGGSKITSGLDSNGNSVLDVAEVTATSYVCNGSAGSLAWIDVTGTSVQAQSNKGYLADNASQVTITLPTSPSFGDVVRVSGAGAGGWKIVQNAGQVVQAASLDGGAIGTVWTARNSSQLWGSIASSADGNRLVATVDGGQIYTSADAGITWTARDATRRWYGVASSADGSRLASVIMGGQIYTSSDFGVNWSAHAASAPWTSIASSADGLKLVAVNNLLQLHTSTDGGQNWTQQSVTGDWAAVASSADGMKLVAAAWNGQLFTSIDAGVTWSASESARTWRSVASSADGVKLVAAVQNGQIYTSVDSGATWISRAAFAQWQSVASSADGNRLVAANLNGQLNFSSDAGVTWVQHGNGALWSAVVSSSDGSKLAALSMTMMFSTIYTSSPAAMSATTTGVGGYIGGRQYEAIELQCVGNNQFMVLSASGSAFDIQ
jgi:hypothetical protein